jgi:hypothetical protein
MKRALYPIKKMRQFVQNNILHKPIIRFFSTRNSQAENQAKVNSMTVNLQEYIHRFQVSVLKRNIKKPTKLISRKRKTA